MKNNDSKKRKSGFNPNRTCYLSADGKYYCYDVWDSSGRTKTTLRYEVGKDLSLELTIMLDEDDHAEDLNDRYEGELRDTLFDKKVASYRVDPDNEDAVNPWDTIADKDSSPDAASAEDEPENPKVAQQRKIDAFPLAPSMIMKTQKSLHVYWFMDSTAKVERFRTIQTQLVKHFDGDPMCVNESRVMRLPGFNQRA